MEMRQCSRALLIGIFICAISVVYVTSQIQCQDCNFNGKSNACNIYKNRLFLRNCTTFKNQVNKAVARQIKNLRLLYFESEIVLPENLKEEFPNLEALDIYGGKPTIETKDVNQQKWPKKLTVLKIHNIEGPLSLPNFADSNIKVLDFNNCHNLIDISNISSLTNLEKLVFHDVNHDRSYVSGLKSIPSGIFKKNRQLEEIVFSISFTEDPVILEDNSFEGLINLQSFRLHKSLSKSDLVNLPPHLFQHCPNLQNITWNVTVNTTFPKHFFPPNLKRFHSNNYVYRDKVCGHEITHYTPHHMQFSPEAFDKVIKENLLELSIICTNHGYDDLIGNFASKFVNLEWLALNNNNIKTLKKPNDIPKTVKRLHLKNNPLICDCVTNQTIRELRLRFEKFNGSSFEYKNEFETCSSDLEFMCNLTSTNITIVSILMIIVMFVIILCIFHSRRYQKHHPTFPSDSDLTYDAFIISHDNDKDILINLLTELQDNYNIVTPHDYLLGIQEFENLYKHINISKRIIIVLSEDFFSSFNETVDLKSCLNEALTNYSKR